MDNKVFSKVTSSVARIGKILKSKIKPPTKNMDPGQEVQWEGIPKEVADALRAQQTASFKNKK